MSTITLHVPAPVAVPRGAPIAAGLVTAAMAVVARAWQSQADLRRSVRLAQEAAALRRYATQLSRHDPSMAADLFAAADRHFKED